MITFSEQRLDTGYIIYNTDGGPEFSTDVVAFNSGFEQRNVSWAFGRGAWDYGDRNLPDVELAVIEKFFRARKGRAQGFRFKDYGDYKVVAGEGILGASGYGTGVPTYQMIKQYASGVDVDYRVIAKPVSGTCTVFGSGTPTVDYTTGIVSFAPTKSATITGITQAANGVVTTPAAHGFVTGEQIYHSGIVGMTQLNNIVVTITVLTTTTYQLNINTAAYAVYTSAGAAGKYPQLTDALTWTGEFDVPVRFETDKLKRRFDGADVVRPGVLGAKYFYLAPLPIVEIRV